MLSGDPSTELLLLLQRSQRACVAVQLCEVGVSPAAATLTSVFAGESPEHRDRRCEMCRVFAHDLESRLHLSSDRYLSQETVMPILTDTCADWDWLVWVDSSCVCVCADKKLLHRMVDTD